MLSFVSALKSEDNTGYSRRHLFLWQVGLVLSYNLLKHELAFAATRVARSGSICYHCTIHSVSTVLQNPCPSIRL